MRAMRCTQSSLGGLVSENTAVWDENLPFHRTRMVTLAGFLWRSYRTLSNGLEGTLLMGSKKRPIG